MDPDPHQNVIDPEHCFFVIKDDKHSPPPSPGEGADPEGVADRAGQTRPRARLTWRLRHQCCQPGEEKGSAKESRDSG